MDETTSSWWKLQQHLEYKNNFISSLTSCGHTHILTNGELTKVGWICAHVALGQALMQGSREASKGMQVHKEQIQGFYKGSQIQKKQHYIYK